LSTGLIALLDDVVAIAKVAATSLDDIAAQTIKAGTKSAGVVIDDAAVTPRYVVGFAASRELPIVAKIAWGSIKNKLLFLLPAALFLSLFAPWMITPLLMLGGAYLCYEGAEKIFEAVFPDKAHTHEREIGAELKDPKAMEDQRVTGAIRTDFILSAEIMAITLSAVPDSSFWIQAAVLALVGIVITLGVYGAVAIIVKADDLGLFLASQTSDSVLGKLSRISGKTLVGGMPYFLSALATIGTGAMIWVGGSILVHGLAQLGIPQPEQIIHHLASYADNASQNIAGILSWIIGALGAGVVGIIIGLLLIPVTQYLIAPAFGFIQQKAGSDA
jgi:predicted DNA repair protein MutK